VWEVIRRRPRAADAALCVAVFVTTLFIAFDGPAEELAIARGATFHSLRCSSSRWLVALSTGVAHSR